MASDVSFAATDRFRAVSPDSPHPTVSWRPNNLRSFLPESPRWLVQKDRVEEAYEVLVTYHAEGDRESEFVKAEFAQIQATISIELENSKASWADLIATSGMRRRMLISCVCLPPSAAF